MQTHTHTHAPSHTFSGVRGREGTVPACVHVCRRYWGSPLKPPKQLTGRCLNLFAQSHIAYPGLNWRGRTERRGKSDGPSKPCTSTYGGNMTSLLPEYSVSRIYMLLYSYLQHVNCLKLFYHKAIFSGSQEKQKQTACGYSIMLNWSENYFLADRTETKLHFHLRLCIARLLPLRKYCHLKPTCSKELHELFRMHLDVNLCPIWHPRHKFQLSNDSQLIDFPTFHNLCSVVVLQKKLLVTKGSSGRLESLPLKPIKTLKESPVFTVLDNIRQGTFNFPRKINS